jgi:small GTP-binding protein
MVHNIAGHVFVFHLETLPCPALLSKRTIGGSAPSNRTIRPERRVVEALERARHVITSKEQRSPTPKEPSVGLFDDLSEFVSRQARRLFRFSTLASIPSTIALTRRFMNSVNWKQAQSDIESDLHRKVAILGLANSGKSTLFNTLRGYYASAVSATAGTTTTTVEGDLGPFALVDTPGHLPDIQAQAAAEAPIVLYLLDASAGLRAQDLATISNLRDDGKTLIVALNKADLLTNPDDDAEKAASRLGVRDVIPISARDGDNVAEELIPALIEASPEAAMILGRQLPKYRRESATKLVRTAALVGLAAAVAFVVSAPTSASDLQPWPAYRPTES